MVRLTAVVVLYIEEGLVDVRVFRLFWSLTCRSAVGVAVGVAVWRLTADIPDIPVVFMAPVELRDVLEPEAPLAISIRAAADDGRSEFRNSYTK